MMSLYMQACRIRNMSVPRRMTFKDADTSPLNGLSNIFNQRIDCIVAPFPFNILF